MPSEIKFARQHTETHGQEARDRPLTSGQGLARRMCIFVCLSVCVCDCVHVSVPQLPIRNSGQRTAGGHNVTELARLRRGDVSELKSG